MSLRRLTVSEFAKKIKDKYPQYANVNDDELAKRIVTKYPVYADKVSFDNSLPAKASRAVVDGVSMFANPTLPLDNPAMNAMEAAGQKIKGEISSIGQGILDANTYPEPTVATSYADAGKQLGASMYSMAASSLGAGIKTLGEFSPFTPTEFATALGSAAVPELIGTARSERMARAVGNRFVGTSTKSLRKSIAMGEPTLGERFLYDTSLPGNRDQAFAEGATKIADLEEIIQSKLNQATNAARRRINPGSTASKEVSGYLPEPTAEITSNPTGGNSKSFPGTVIDITNDAKFEKPYMGAELPISGEGESVGFKTPKQRFKKGGSQGVFNPETPEEIATQEAYKRATKKEALTVEASLKKNEASIPRYGFKTNNPYAITRDEIAQGFDDAAKELGNSGFNKDDKAKLELLKEEFISSHPEVADLSYWNNVKRDIYSNITDKGYLNENPSYKIKVQKAVARRIRMNMNRILPDLNGLNAEQGLYLQILDGLEGKQVAEAKSLTAAAKSDLKDELAVAAARRSGKKSMSPIKDTISSSLFLPAYKDGQK